MCASVDSPGTAVSARWCAGWLIVVAIGLLPLVCWPGLARPFSSPKLWLVAALDLLVAFRCLTRERSGWALPPWPWLLWIGAISLSAVTAAHLSTDAFLLLVLPLPLALA